MKWFIYIVFFLSLPLCSFSQYKGSNAVANPGFENIIQCPDDYMQLNKAINWYGTNTDLYHSCNPNMVPYNLGGFQYPHTGNAYAGFIRIGFHSINKGREFIHNKLAQPLAKKKYCVDYYYSISE